MEIPERRSAIAASELDKYYIDIAALSVVWFSDAGYTREDASYAIFWSGKSNGEAREHLCSKCSVKPSNNKTA